MGKLAKVYKKKFDLGGNAGSITGAVTPFANMGIDLIDANRKNPARPSTGISAAKGATQGAALGANPALVAATGGLSIAAGALIGGTVGYFGGKKSQENYDKQKALEDKQFQDARNVIDTNANNFTKMQVANSGYNAQGLSKNFAEGGTISKAFKGVKNLIPIKGNTESKDTTRYEPIMFNTPLDSLKKVYPNKYEEGGSIHIKPSHKGLFTAKANSAGESVQTYASHVLANKENFSSATVKQANFAKNASKWKHRDGGNLIPLNSDSQYVDGAKHENGGVAISQTAEVEGGEVLKDKDDSIMVISDSLKNPLSKKGNTFAKDDTYYAKKIGKYEGSTKLSDKNAVIALNKKRNAIEQMQQIMNGNSQGEI